MASPLQWRHNEHDGFSNHQPHRCLLNRLFRHQSSMNFPHKWPVTRKMFPFDDVIMQITDKSIVYVIVCWGVHQRTHQSSESPAIWEEYPSVAGGYPFIQGQLKWYCLKWGPNSDKRCTIHICLVHKSRPEHISSKTIFSVFIPNVLSEILPISSVVKLWFGPELNGSSHP